MRALTQVKQAKTVRVCCESFEDNLCGECAVWGMRALTIARTRVAVPILWVDSDLVQQLARTLTRFSVVWFSAHDFDSSFVQSSDHCDW